MRRLMILAALALVAGLMALGGNQAAAEPPAVSPFSWTQTYHTTDAFYWGPAVYYGGTVTLVYDGASRSHFSDGRFQMKITGTATVYAGETATGDPIDVRDFENQEMWYEPANTWGWPVSWYTCGVERLYYRWSIAGVYDFVITAKDGYWTIETTAHTPPPTRGGWYAGDETPIEFDSCP